MHLCALIIAVVLTTHLLAAGVWAQGSPPPESAPSRQGQSGADQSYAPVGQSGYRVYIPEVKMKSIIGDRQKKEAPPQQGPQPGPTPAVQEEQPDSRPSHEAPPVHPGARLPFEPSERAPAGPRPSTLVPREEPKTESAPEAAPVRPTPAESRPAPVAEPPAAAPTPEPEQPDESPPAVSPPPQADRRPTTESPQPRVVKPAVPRPEVLPEQPVEEPQTLVTAPRGKPAVKEPLRAVTAPSAPEEDLLIPPTPPKKERFPRAPASKPPLLLGNQPVKGKGKVAPLASVEVDDMADPRNWVPLAARPEAQVIPDPETTAVAKKELQPPSPQAREEEPEKEVKRQPEPGSSPTPVPLKPSEPAPVSPPPAEPRPGRESQPEPQPMKPPEPGPVAAEQPSATLPEPRHEDVPEKPETTPPAPVAALPPREVIPSPLDEDALDNREVAEYLRATVPILEELSQLMMRGPSLSIADYDPSDPNAPTVPRDLHVQMDSMKRELQVLDSKTFAVIPPKKYVAFHELIRESIAHTYQACDAVIAYLTESNPANLKKVQDHLLKARELIQRTRERSARG